jgi:hypothetical protein
VQAAAGADALPAMAAAGKAFALHDLSPEALSCYWYEALLQYSELYFLEETKAQRAAREEAGGGKGGRRRL